MITKILLTLFAIFSTATIFSQSVPPIQHNLTPSAAVIILTPFIIWLAVWIVNALTPKLHAGILLLIVTVLNLATAFLSTFIVSDANLWLQFAVGFGSVFVNEVLKAFKKKE